MTLITQSIPNLINGVSQQPAAVRLPSQCEEMENCYPTVDEFLHSRPPTYICPELPIPSAALPESREARGFCLIRRWTAAEGSSGAGERSLASDSLG